MEIITQNSRETKKAGGILAEKILKNKKKVILGLEGDLGSGKTTFIQGLARGLKIKEKIASPTFVIFKKYSVQKRNFYHIDCYRINSSDDLIDLGFEEILKSDKNIIVIEWAERIKDILPKNILWIKFEYLNQNKRKLSIR